MKKQKITTSYLIMHENEIDWEDLSKDRNRSFSLAEIRIFRSKINWHTYLLTHDDMSPEELEVASKYFTELDYNLIGIFNIATEDFLEKHIADIKWEVIIENSNISAKFLMNNFEKWKDIDKRILTMLFRKNKYFDLSSKEFEPIVLFLGL